MSLWVDTWELDDVDAGSDYKPLCDDCGKPLTFAEIGRGSLCNRCQARAILDAARQPVDDEPLPFADRREVR